MSRATLARWGRWLTPLLMLLVLALLWHHLRQLDWRAVLAHLQGYDAVTLVVAGLTSAAIYTLYSSFDLFGRHYAGLQQYLPVQQLLPRVFVCYAFNLNLSALLGALALRYRFYSRFQISVADTTRIIVLSLATNWSGYLLLAGLLSLASLPPLPASLSVLDRIQPLLGLFCLLGLGAALWWCHRRAGQPWHWRGHRLVWPSPHMALLQCLAGAAAWSMMGGLLWWLLPHGSHYPTVLAVLLASGLAGLIARIPAGLGVLEATVIMLLSGRHEQSVLVAALIAYRAFYFLLPLLVAALLYPWLEWRMARRSGPEHL